MYMETKFKASEVNIKKAKPYGILMPKEEIGATYCCIPLVDGMEVSVANNNGAVTGEYEMLYREVLPRDNAGVIRLPRIYMSCDVLLLK